ncbi:thiol-disulfide isomerase/thioredoxin [Chitinophaga niastensis]|uniref:Thiol-disulfide isomerase/thioredoxin n=1 Tax=Chitinophaga niastensis TaxID=536980 RepID=A0A2P8HJI0_CHINA|nr:TlpA disulfide reductase family protein [Chitinophaga niastensis]PSL46330.1 thiol-disulfide isomerase/thioredoxin [Chitinophaga niastensis]
MKYIIQYNKIKAFVLTMNVLLLFSGGLMAQSKEKPADIPKLKIAVEAHPGDIKVHRAFVNAMRKDSAGLVKQYEKWMQQFPAAAAVPFAFGEFYTNQESPAARPFLLKAVGLNPKLAAAWEELSTDAERWGDFKAANEYLAKAVAAAPNNPDYIYYYNNSFENSDPEKYYRLNMEMVKQFPKSQRSAQAIYWLAFKETDVEKKTALYEKLRTDFPLTKFSWSVYAMTEYFDLLLSTDPARALQLSNELMKLPGLDGENKKELERAMKIATQLRSVQQLLAANKPEEASKILAEVKSRKWSSQSQTVALLKATASSNSGHTQQAYDSLLVCYVKTPVTPVKEALLTYADKLGKNKDAVDAEIWKKLSTDAKQASFTFDSYMSGNNISLKDYKGKVVLLTFWFPGCGPCRGEFPHFERVLKQFNGTPVSYVGVNVARDQDAYVVPFMKSSGYSFTALKDNEAKRNNLEVRGAPSNYLIDQEGRIIFHSFMIQNREEELMLQEMISLLLKHPAS